MQGRSWEANPFKSDIPSVNSNDTLFCSELNCIERGTRWRKFYVATIHNFWSILKLRWKMADFEEMLLLNPKTELNIDLE